MESMAKMAQRYNAITLLAEDDTIPQDDVNAALVELVDDIKAKGENGIIWLNAVDEAIAGAKERKKKYDAYIKMLESRKARMMRAYIYALNSMGVKSIMTAEGEIKVKKNPPSVVVDDLTQIPTQYQRTKIQVDIDKTAIKKAIKDGDTVPGAHLEQAESLSY